MDQADTRDDHKRTEVIRAARECFVHFGLKRATMDDVATATGFSRRSIYQYAGNKTELIAAVFAEELRRACAAATARLDFALPPAQLIALAEVSLFAGAIDNAFIKRVLDVESLTVTMEVAGNDKQIRAIMVEYWTPVLDHLDGLGQLRTDVPRERLLVWLLWVHQMLLAQPSTLTEDLDLQEEMLQQFLAPALLTPGGALGPWASPDGLDEKVRGDVVNANGVGR